MRIRFLLSTALMALASSAAAQLTVSGVIDGPLTGGTPKAIEIYVSADVPDLTIYGIGSANNGGGSDGQEFTLPAGSATAGSYLYLASESAQFQAFFGFAPNYTDNAASINGDDAIELFKSGVVIDVFGDINVDGNGQPWEYLDGWAYRTSGTGPDGSTFTLGSWTFSGANALDGATSNATAATPFPIGTYVATTGDVPPVVSNTSPANGADDVAVDANIQINFSENVTVAGTFFDLACDMSGANSGTVSNANDAQYVIDPATDFVAGDTCTVTVFAAQVTDQDMTPDNMAADFVFSFSVPAPPSLVFIHEVQGSGDSSPLDDQTVIIEGVVTGDFQRGDADDQSNLDGFFVQEEDGDVDADPATSEGIFVFDGFAPAVDVNVGDLVRVTGTATEFFGETQISFPLVEVIGTGTVSATAIALPTANALLVNNEYIADLEQYEGMLVTFSDMLTVTELFNLDRFGEMLLAQGGRFEQFTNNNLPDAAGLDAFRQDIGRRAIMLDDGVTIQNPDPIRYPDPGLPNMVGALVRAGDNVVGLTGNLRYSRGSGGSGDETYRLMPTVEPVFVVNNPAPTTAPDVGGSLKVASFNVLNFFTTLDGNGSICGPAMNQGCRGADNQAEFDRQRAKLLTALVALDADVVGLIELENNATAALQNITDGLNAAVGAGTYDFINNGTIGTDAIRVGLIFKTTTVTAFGASAILDSSVDPLFNDDKNRPVLAQSFQEIAGGGVFTVAVNHLKSKGSSCDDVGDPDTGDGQANCNGVRTDAAIALANWLATDPTGSGDSDALIMGDLNAYMREDPIIAIENAGYTNLLATFAGADGYSFLFDGQFGTLDHALSSPALTSQVTGAATWHISADDADAIDYNLDFGRNADIFDGTIVNRASDHDPVVVGLDLVGDADTDGDGVADSIDNCTIVANPDQRDTDGDGHGNICDADLNNDCIVNVVDLGILRTVFFTTDEDADFNGDGIVNVVDLGRLRTLFFSTPGPSADGALCSE
ncbi:MAG: ExeM/NucH family extracellular endonuclease [Gammaproteobacteria bacterium]